MSANYRFSAEKAAAAIHWMVCQGKAVDLHTALKALYFADKSFLNQHFQPIFGATYKAMKYGPVALEPYEMMKGEGLYLYELGVTEAPWQLTGYNLSVVANDEPDMTVFSKEERSHLQEGFATSCALNFTDRTAVTHGPDWQKAYGGIMRYEDMLDPQNQTEEVIKFLQESAPTLRL